MLLVVHKRLAIVNKIITNTSCFLFLLGPTSNTVSTDDTSSSDSDDEFRLGGLLKGMWKDTSTKSSEEVWASTLSIHINQLGYEKMTVTAHIDVVNLVNETHLNVLIIFRMR